MTATLRAVPAATRVPPATGYPAATRVGLGRAASEAFQGYLPRPVRRVPLLVVTAPPVPDRPTAAVYHQRRILALVAGFAVLVVVLVSAYTGFAWLGQEATAGATSPVPTVVVAGPGDSYWSLAGRLHRAGDLRSTVDALVAANGGRELRAGDRLVLAP
jgi:hypothetical protein